MTAIAAPIHYDLRLDRRSVEKADDGSIWITGLASDFDFDRQNEVMVPGCFDSGLQSFLRDNPIMLWNHDYGKPPLGVWTEAWTDSKGLHVKGRIHPPAKGSWAEDIVRKAVAGVVRGLSVGGLFYRDGNKIRRCDLTEISLCSLPVNSRGSFKVVAGKAFAAVERGDLDPETVALNARVDRLAGQALTLQSQRLIDQVRSAL